jgi:hypothetical protein
MRRFAIATVFVLFASALHAGKPSAVAATLVLPSASVLPGVPFDIEVTLENHSARTVKVGSIAYLHVASSDGAEVPLMPRFSSACIEDDEIVRDGYVEVGPGETVRRVINWDHASANWFVHEAFSGPGVYDLSLDLKVGQYPEGEDMSNYVGALSTSTARLERTLTLGDDTALWQRMQEVSGGHWSDDGFTRLKEGKELAKEIIAVHPASGYYPYALLLYSIDRREKDIPVLLEAAERFRESPAYPYLLKAAGDAANAEAWRANYQKESARAAHLYELAEKYYNEALKTKSLAVQEGAERGLTSATSTRAIRQAR